MVDIKPCPFCGGYSIIEFDNHESDESQPFRVKCRECKATGPESRGVWGSLSQDARAVTDWNKLSEERYG